MIIRLSQKLATRIKAGKLRELPLDENPFADWSAHLFVVDRIQYIILSNTVSLYSCVMYGKAIANDSRFIQRALDCVHEFMKHDGCEDIYLNQVAPSSRTVSFAKAFNRQVIGSMNELVFVASRALESGETAPCDMGFRLNDLLLSAIATSEDQGYSTPRIAFQRLSPGNLK
jgi:hypothetical protein